MIRTRSRPVIPQTGCTNVFFSQHRLNCKFNARKMATHFLLGYQVVSKSFENFYLNCVNALFNSFKERLALFDFENMPSIFSELFFNQQKLFLCTTNLPTMLSLDKSLLPLGGQTYWTYWAGPFDCSNWHNSFFMTS